MRDYDKENWVELYPRALVELEQAMMAGRIGHARTEIASRVEKLKQLPGHHAEESHAIDDALRTLRVLETEEQSVAAVENRRRLEDALQKLKSLAPKIPNR
jgi:hypothetical protein